MTDQVLQGKITFVQYEKEFVSIEYVQNGKTKTINGSIKEAAQKKLKDEKLIKKFHHFREGDEVSFVLTRSVRGDKMTADRIQYLYNNSLSNLLHKASTENEFTGYLKQVDDKFFIKEMDSYHFFPLKLSPWEKKPYPDDLNEAVNFKLLNYSNPDKVSASLLHPSYIPEFKKAQKLFESKTVIDAKISKVTPHGIYVEVVGSKLQGKLPLPGDKETTEQPGDIIKITITYLSPDRIVIQRA